VIKNLNIDPNARQVVFDAVCENVNVHVDLEVATTTFKTGRGAFGGNTAPGYLASGNYPKDDALELLFTRFSFTSGNVYPQNLEELNLLSVLCETDTGWAFPLHEDSRQARLVLNPVTVREIRAKLEADETNKIGQEMWLNIATMRIKISDHDDLIHTATLEDFGLTNVCPEIR
jgi:hypothetical protein